MLTIDEINRLEQENKELKVKCKELNKKLIDADAGKTQYSFYLDKEEKENEKLKQTLEEIRKIAEIEKMPDLVTTDELARLYNMRMMQLKTIRNKINEVLGEENE